MTDQSLIYRSGGRLYALSLAHVIEIMRPLPLAEEIGGGSLIRGVTTIRGEQTTVIDLSSFSDAPAVPAQRLVSLRTGSGRFALLADDVLGVGTLEGEQARLLEGGDKDATFAVRRLDAELRTAIEDIRTLPEGAYESAMPA